MSNILYLTADHIEKDGGGGPSVTWHEREAFQRRAEKEIITLSRKELSSEYNTFMEPWGWDERASSFEAVILKQITRAHIYSGTFSKTVARLKEAGAKVSYTIAAHDRFISRREHEKLGYGFNYPHLTDEGLWKKYIEGYVRADHIVCPSEHSAACVRQYGGCDRITIIPHGCDIPEFTTLPPDRFTVGYLGAIGPDKGIVYLLQAWKKLNYKDSLLVIAGRESASQMMANLFHQYGGGCVHMAGWQRNISDFYNSLSLYVQPSATEGFGLEVLEAMAHARPTMISHHACAEVLDYNPEMTFPACNSDEIAQRIDMAKKEWNLKEIGEDCREIAKNYSWDKIEQRYIDFWRTL